VPYPLRSRLGPGELRHELVVEDGGTPVPEGIALLDPRQEPDVTSRQLWGNEIQSAPNGVDRSVDQPGERHVPIVPLALRMPSFPTIRGGV
jgi:hypothetical protein